MEIDTALNLGLSGCSLALVRHGVEEPSLTRMLAMIVQIPELDSP